MYIGKLVGSAIQTVFFDNKCMGGCKLQMAALTLTNLGWDISVGSTVETVTITPA